MIFQLKVEGLGENFKKMYEYSLENLLERAPSDACACSSIIRTKKGCLGMLDIFSSERHFSAICRGLGPRNTAHALFVQIQEQFKKWHRERDLASA